MKTQSILAIMTFISLIGSATNQVEANEINRDTTTQLDNASVDPEGNLKVTPSKASSADDFDFLEAHGP